MIAARSPVRSINTILLSDGREIHLDDIATAEEGQAILDDVDTSIDGIEQQFSSGRAPPDADWYRRAGTALKKKRRIRPRLQQRIGELRRAERQVRPEPGPGQARLEARRKAFINAAEQMLEHNLFTEIWARAAEIEPSAFQGREAQA